MSPDNDDEGSQRLEPGEQGPVVADGGARHLHVAEHVGDADQHQQHRKQCTAVKY